MPLELRLIVVGDRHGLADFHDIEPELSEQAVYGEYEEDLQLTEIDDMVQWCGYVNALIDEKQLPPLAADAWYPLMVQAVRHSGDQGNLPLSPQWISQQLSEAALYAEEESITAKAFEAALNAREWRESYLAERMQDEIELGQILIETEGKSSARSTACRCWNILATHAALANHLASAVWCILAMVNLPTSSAKPNLAAICMLKA